MDNETTAQPTPVNPSWERVLLARHPKRPHSLDYIGRVFTGFTELHGDRTFADDPAVVGGFAFFDDRPVMVIGQQKGRDTKQKLHRNFGMPKPEGYRKALRVMKLAEKFHRPVFTLIDTPGAYPGIDAEERGQAEAIAVNLREMSQLTVPVIATVTGEGGSGGALAIGVADRVNMLECSIYSVISPESCSSILWRDQNHAADAAEALKITPEDLRRFHLIDEVIPEPEGGAHNDHSAMAAAMDRVLDSQLRQLESIPVAKLVQQRYEKFRAMGAFAQ